MKRTALVEDELMQSQATWVSNSWLPGIKRKAYLLPLRVQSNMSMHHYECIALCFVNILQ